MSQVRQRQLGCASVSDMDAPGWVKNGGERIATNDEFGAQRERARKSDGHQGGVSVVGEARCDVRQRSGTVGTQFRHMQSGWCVQAHVSSLVGLVALRTDDRYIRIEFEMRKDKSCTWGLAGSRPSWLEGYRDVSRKGIRLGRVYVQ